LQAPPSVNHSAPSGPAVIDARLWKPGKPPNMVTAPDVVMRPSLLPLLLGSWGEPSQNHSAPSGPVVISLM
jgi:hypothetical protein